MSNTTLKLPALMTSVTMNAVVYNVDVNQEISVPSDIVAALVRNSWGVGHPDIIIGVSKPPTNPTT